MLNSMSHRDSSVESRGQEGGCWGSISAGKQGRQNELKQESTRFFYRKTKDKGVEFTKGFMVKNWFSGRSISNAATKDRCD